MTAQRLLLVSNRLPVTVKLERGEIAVGRSGGGLATGLRGPHEQSGGLWIGWPGDVSRMSEAQRRKLDAHLEELRCVPVYLSGAEVSRYYDGFSNAVLWPLFHYLLDRIPPHSQEWEVYRAVNERFADAVARVWRPGDMILGPRLPALAGSAHAPRAHPRRDDRLLSAHPLPGVGGAAHPAVARADPRGAARRGSSSDLAHQFTYRSHFASSVLRILGISTPGDRVFVDGREIRLGVFPIGVDAQTFGKLAEDPGGARRGGLDSGSQARGERILLGIDRLDYTKGIPRRLLAYERLLEREPHWRGKVRPTPAAAVPSRDKVPSYQEFRRTAERAFVGRINGAFSSVDWVPIHYVHRSLTEQHVVALYRAADVMLVTPLRDGMNLVAKEFVTARPDEDGVLVLSEFAGAAAEMGEALQVNPYDIETMSQAFSDALRMPEEERKLRMRSLRQRIASRDVHHWAQSFIDALGSIRGTAAAVDRAPLSSPDDLAALAARLRSAERLVLLLDYDGTLVPFARSPDLRGPRIGLATCWGGARRGKPGRARSRGQRATKGEPLSEPLAWGLARRTSRRTWLLVAHGARPSLGRHERRERRVEARCEKGPGSGHGRDAGRPRRREDGEPGLALPNGGAGACAPRAPKSFWHRLEQVLRGTSAELLRGEKVIEVRPGGVTKARVVERVIAQFEAPLPAIAAMGDDRTDEDLFLALPPDAVAIGVGFRPTIAPLSRGDSSRGARSPRKHPRATLTQGLR